MLAQRTQAARLRLVGAQWPLPSPVEKRLVGVAETTQVSGRSDRVSVGYRAHMACAASRSIRRGQHRRQGATSAAQATEMDDDDPRVRGSTARRLSLGIKAGDVFRERPTGTAPRYNAAFAVLHQVRAGTDDLVARPDAQDTGQVRAAVQELTVTTSGHPGKPPVPARGHRFWDPCPPIPVHHPGHGGTLPSRNSAFQRL